MNDSKNISMFKRRWLTLGEAALALETDEEGLLQTFESGEVRDLAVYVLSDRQNFSGMCTPLRFAHRLADNDEFRKNVGDKLGRIANHPRRKKTEDWERWFQLIGAFRIFPSSLRRIARDRALFACPVAPASWWTAESPVPRNASGDPKVRFDAQIYDRVAGEKPISFRRIRFKAEDIQEFISTAAKEPVETSVRDLPSDGKWPWGDYDTKALGHLEAAARKFWVNYDPADPTTAEENRLVAEWLMTERGMKSRNMAKMIATILRSDKLRPARRK